MNVDTPELIGIAWLLGAIIMLVAIRRAARKDNVPYNNYQGLVALIWPLWIGFYLYTLVVDRSRVA